MNDKQKDILEQLVDYCKENNLEISLLSAQYIVTFVVNKYEEGINDQIKRRTK